MGAGAHSLLAGCGRLCRPRTGWRKSRWKCTRASASTTPKRCFGCARPVGPLIGANFDPSHLFWQGIDPVAAIRRLGDAIYFVHAKDTRLDPLNGPVNGMLDTKRFTCEQERSWLFRTVGYGHDALVWKDIVSNLRMAGYDDVLSIEHEDSLMSPREGLEKAIAFLRGILMYDSKNNDVFWA